MDYTNQVRRWSGPDPISTSPLTPEDRLPMSADTIWTYRIDSSGLERILKDAVDGDFTLTHTFLPPRAEVRPTNPLGSIHVHATPFLSLKGDQRTIQGPYGVLDLAIWFEGAETHLREVGLPPRGQMPRSAPPRRQASVSRPVKASPPMRPRLATVDEPAPAPVAPDAPMPDALQTLCVQAGVNRALGDYLVVPDSYLPGIQLPAGVVRSPRVDVVHIVQPRFGGKDTAISDEKEHGHG